MLISPIHPNTMMFKTPQQLFNLQSINGIQWCAQCEPYACTRMSIAWNYESLSESLSDSVEVYWPFHALNC